MKYYTRDQYRQFLNTNSKKMSKDINLQNQILDCLIKANNYYWIQQSTWMNEPCLQLPQDMTTIAEIIYKTKPDYIIETGIGWGGLTLFCASILSIIKGKKIFSIDINVPNDLLDRINNKPKHITKYINFICGSSVDQNIVNLLKNKIKNDKCLIILDSNHVSEHVLQELELYHSFIGSSMYIVVCDTIINNIPDNLVNRKREWNQNNNPKIALDYFLKKHKNFKQDIKLHNKLLLSCNTYIYKT